MDDGGRVRRQGLELAMPPTQTLPCRRALVLSPHIPPRATEALVLVDVAPKARQRRLDAMRPRKGTPLPNRVKSPKCHLPAVPPGWEPDEVH